MAVHYGRSEAAANKTAAAIEQAGGRAFIVGAELGVAGDVDTLFAGLTAGLAGRPLDILVNNAGGALGVGSIEETTPEEFDRLIALNMRAPFFIIQRALPLLRDGGRIINISTALTRTSFPRSGPYASAKAAMEVLTQYQALEYGDRGITANAIAVGAVPTDFGNGNLRSNPDLQKVLIDLTALKRLATPEDIGLAVAGLATASGTWITGQRIEASGGIRL